MIDTEQQVVHEVVKVAGPYSGGDVKQAVDMGVAVYSIDFGDEGTGLYVRLEDFNRKVATDFQDYIDCFYELVETLGITSDRRYPPRGVWVKEIIPRLSELLAAQQSNVVGFGRNFDIGNYADAIEGAIELFGEECGRTAEHYSADLRELLSYIKTTRRG